jgi:hypothetical protein
VGCPCCPQTSSRYWNLKTHIKRQHNGVGVPITAQNDNYRKTPSSYYPSFSPKVVPRKEAFPRSNHFESMLSFLRESVEFYDLLKRLPSQQSVSTETMLSWLLQLIYLSKPNTFQKNNVLPAGYRVQVCNNCLRGNCLESVLDSSIELDALTKTKHTCEIQTSGLSKIRQDKEDLPNIIIEVQEKLLSCLKQAIFMRIVEHQGRSKAHVSLKAHEFYGHKLLLQHLGNKRLPDDKSSIAEEEYINLGKIGRSIDGSLEEKNHWTSRLIKEEGFTKIIKINENELLEFIRVSKATFGTFEIQIDDESIRLSSY